MQVTKVLAKTLVDTDVVVFSFIRFEIFSNLDRIMQDEFIQFSDSFVLCATWRLYIYLQLQTWSLV